MTMLLNSIVILVLLRLPLEGTAMPEHDFSRGMRDLSKLNGHYHPEGEHSHTHEHHHPIPTEIDDVGGGYIDGGNIESLVPSCGCVQRGYCGAQQEAITAEILSVRKTTLVCGLRFQHCCYYDPWNGITDEYAHLAPCVPEELCARQYGTSPTDIRDFGSIPQCPGYGSVRCLDSFTVVVDNVAEAPLSLVVPILSAPVVEPIPPTTPAVTDYIPAPTPAVTYSPPPTPTVTFGPPATPPAVTYEVPAPEPVPSVSYAPPTPVVAPPPSVSYAPPRPAVVPPPSVSYAPPRPAVVPPPSVSYAPPRPVVVRTPSVSYAPLQPEEVPVLEPVPHAPLQPEGVPVLEPVPYAPLQPEGVPVLEPVPYAPLHPEIVPVPGPVPIPLPGFGGSLQAGLNLPPLFIPPPPPVPYGSFNLFKSSPFGYARIQKNFGPIGYGGYGGYGGPYGYNGLGYGFGKQFHLSAGGAGFL